MVSTTQATFIGFRQCGHLGIGVLRPETNRNSRKGSDRKTRFVLQENDGLAAP
jgi:hypothetical protein